jgi:hypothetical protein
MLELEKQFVTDHPWWHEYMAGLFAAAENGEVEEFSNRETERRTRLREEAEERIGWTGGPDW